MHVVEWINMIFKLFLADILDCIVFKWIVYLCCKVLWAALRNCVVEVFIWWYFTQTSLCMHINCSLWLWHVDQISRKHKWQKQTERKVCVFLTSCQPVRLKIFIKSCILHMQICLCALVVYDQKQVILRVIVTSHVPVYMLCWQDWSAGGGYGLDTGGAGREWQLFFWCPLQVS